MFVAINDSQEAAARAARGETQTAEELYQRALATLELAVGPDHPTVAEALMAYAVLLDETGRSARADELRARAERILAAVDGS